MFGFTNLSTSILQKNNITAIPNDCNSSENILQLFMKVDFTTIRVVTAIATKGRYPGATQYVTRYRLLHSANCVNFTVYKEPVSTEKVNILQSRPTEFS